METKFNNTFKDNQKIVYLFASICMFMLAYGLVFNDYIYNHDSVYRIQEGIQSLSSGRFARNWLNQLLSFGTYSPINASFLTYVFMTFGAYILCKLFAVKSLFKQIVLSSVIYCYPIFAFFWTYGNDIWQYSLAFSLSILAIYLVVKNSWLSRLQAVFIIVLLLGIYQSFLATLTATFLMYYLIAIVEQRQVLIKDVIINFLTLIIATIVYYLFLQVLIALSDQTMTTYKGADSIGLKSIILNIPLSLQLAYQDFLNFILAKGDFFGTFFSRPVLNIVLLSSYPALIYKMIKEKRMLKDILMVVIIIILIPIFISSNIFILGEVLSYSSFGYVILIFIAIYCLLNYFNYKSLALIPIGIYIYLSFFLVNNMLFFEQAQTQVNEQIGTQMLTDIQAYPGYTKDMQVNICGSFGQNENVQFSSPTKYQLTHKRFKPGANRSIFTGVRPEKMKYLFDQLGYQININEQACVSQNDLTTIKDYPEPGYIQIEDKQMYVNIG